MTDDELLHEVLVASRHAFVPMPDTRVIERPGWMQLITPSMASGGMNEVALAVLGDDEVEAVIDATIAEYRQQGIRFRWTVGPDSRPLDLAARVQARGLRVEIALGLACAADRLVFDMPPGVRVEPVDEHNLRTYAQVMADGWGRDVEALLGSYQNLLGHPSMPMQLASFDGQPAGAALVALLPRSGFLLGAVVLPEFRGRGVYRAMIAERAWIALARGVPLLTTHARATTSGPILLNMGFRELCRLTMLLA